VRSPDIDAGQQPPAPGDAQQLNSAGAAQEPRTSRELAPELAAALKLIAEALMGAQSEPAEQASMDSDLPASDDADIAAARAALWRT
jgi:hypothetical protein